MNTLIEYKGFEIKIHRDIDPINPREEFDPLGTMVCFHNRYNLGDNHEFPDSDSVFEYFQELFFEDNDVIFLPLYLYDHSGITMNTSGFSCGWDSMQVGVIYMEKKKAIDTFGLEKYEERAIACLQAEVEEYDQFLTGEVYGYSVEKGEYSDSCYGFFGNTDHMISEAKGNIDYHKQSKRLRVL